MSEDLRHPRYAAALMQSGSTLEVVLTEHRDSGSTALAGAIGSGAGWMPGYNLHLGDNFFPVYPGRDDSSTYPNIVERVSDGTFLVVDGQP